MPYVRKRGRHLAIVHGSRNAETKKVDQHVLMTLHSKAEALAALGRTSEQQGRSFRASMEDRYPEIRFNWSKIDAALAEQMDELRDIARSREERAMSGFDDALANFARYIIDADPQTLDSARELIQKNRSVLTWLMDLADWRLKMAEATEPSQWSRDPFGWRLALGGGTFDPELEEGLADRIHEGEPEEAEDIFLFLTKLYPRYAEAWNYLGLISLDRGDLDEALTRFETCESIGRKLFPKRIPKAEYWGRLETRPYMRGLMNQWVTLNRMGRFGRALRIAERLENECGDDTTAAVYRAATHLNLGDWQLAYDAAVHVTDFLPEQSLIAALAAFELGELDVARTRFIHAMLNKPRATAIVLDKSRGPERNSFAEVSDHNAGVALLRNLHKYLGERTKASEGFFTTLWNSKQLRGLRQEVLDAESELEELRGPRTDERRYRELFDRLNRVRSWEFAESNTTPTGSLS